MIDSSGQTLAFGDLVLFATKAKDEHGMRSSTKTVLRPSFVIDKELIPGKEKIQIVRFLVDDTGNLDVSKLSMDYEKLVKVTDTGPFEYNQCGSMLLHFRDKILDGLTYEEARDKFKVMRDLLTL